jgi:hypothetical protein
MSCRIPYVMPGDENIDKNDFVQKSTALHGILVVTCTPGDPSIPFLPGIPGVPCENGGHVITLADG